jgi:hypothetical protein
MTKTNMSHGQGSSGPMVDSMSHHLLDLHREASKPIGNARPYQQHHRNGGDHHLTKCRVIFTAGLYQGSEGMCPSGHTISLAGSLHQLPVQTLAGPSPLHHSACATASCFLTPREKKGKNSELPPSRLDKSRRRRNTTYQRAPPRPPLPRPWPHRPPHSRHQAPPSQQRYTFLVISPPE